MIEKRYKAILLTSNQLRHMYVAHMIARNFDLAGVVSESKPKTVGLDKPDIKKDEEDVIVKHFKLRDETEKKYFSAFHSFPLADNDILLLDRGGVNSRETFEWIRSRMPDVILLFGTAIVKDPLLGAYPDTIINMHLGLSPYYKGAGTNFWPLVNNEPECVGTTIHKAILKVDAGEILAQVRPGADADDNSHDLGCKAVIEGVRAMCDATVRYLDGNLQIHRQAETGRVYKKKDFNASAVITMYENFKNGMMAAYINDKIKRDDRFPIIELKEYEL